MRWFIRHALKHLLTVGLPLLLEEIRRWKERRKQEEANARADSVRDTDTAIERLRQRARDSDGD